MEHMKRPCGESHMDNQIHCLEREAYGAVLKALVAQSESLSWDKEELITELRKELRVSDVEHREILGKINLDDSVKLIREWRKANGAQQLIVKNYPISNPILAAQSSRKRLKFAQKPVVSPPTYESPLPSPMKIRNSNCKSHNTHSSQMHGGRAVMPIPHSRQPPSVGTREPNTILTSGKISVRSGPGSTHPKSDIIEVRATEELLKEVEKISGGVNPDLGQIGKAKLVLTEHERALMNALQRLAEVSDGDDSPIRQKQHQYFVHDHEKKNLGFHNSAYGYNMSKNNYDDIFVAQHAEG